jgi:hypothetical protein
MGLKEWSNGNQTDEKHDLNHWIFQDCLLNQLKKSYQN